MASASIGDLVISIAADLAKLELGMSRAQALTAQTAQRIDAAMKVAGDAIAGVAAGFVSLKAVEAFASNVEGAIEAAAALQKLSESTGVAATSLSALKGIAKQSGTDIGEVAAGLQRMSKSVVETSMGTGRAALAFRALGINAKEMGKLMPEQQMQLFAQKLMNLESETQKVGLAMKVIRDPNLLPFLKDLAEAGELNGMVTNRQAREAEAYERAVRKLDSAKKAFYNTIAEQVTPALTVLVRVMTDLRTSAGGLNDVTKQLAAQNQIRQWAFEGALAIGYIIDGLRYVQAGVVTIGQALALPALYIVESFKSCGTIIGIVAGILEQFGHVVLAVDMILRGQFSAGTQALKVAMTNIGSGAIELKDTVGEAFTHIAGAGKAFFDDFGVRANNFAAGSWADKVYDMIAKVTNGVDKLAKKGREHADAEKVVTDAYDGLIQKLTVTSAKLQTELDFIRKNGYATNETAEATTRAVLEEAKMVKVLNERAIREGTTVQALKDRAVAEAKKNDELTHSLALETEYANLIKSENEQYSQLLKNLTDQIEQLGMTEGAVTRLKIARLEELRAASLAMDKESQVAKDLLDQIEKLTKIAIAQDTLQGMKNFTGAIMQAADMVGNIARGFMDGVTSGIEAARKELKNFIADLIAMFAKKWFLSIIAGATGDTGLAGAAAQIGQGTITGAISNAAMSYLGSTALGSYLGIGAPAAGAMTVTGGATVGVGANAAAGGSSLMSGVMAVAPYIAIAIAGAAIAGGQFARGWSLNNPGNRSGLMGPAGPGGFNTATDSIFRALGMNDQWAAMLSGSSVTARLFGHQARRMDRGGVEGSFSGAGGFAGSNWYDWTEKGGWFRNDNHGTEKPPLDASQLGFFKDMMLGVAQTVGAFAQQLGVDATSILANYGHEFKFDFKDKTDAEVNAMMSGLFGDVLREQVSTLFTSSGHEVLAQYVDQLQGTTGEVTNSILELLGVMEGVKHLNFKAVDAEAILAMGREGETIGQTFQRIASTMAEFDDKFMTDAQKLKAATDFVAATFSDLSIAIPADSEAFWNLVHGLDLTTESGRHMFDMLMVVAPAFQTVEAAAKNAVSTFYSLASQLSASFGKSYARMNLDATIASWRSISHTPTDFDIEGYLRHIIETGTFAEHLPFIQSLGPGALEAFNAMLAAYQAWQQAANTPGSNPTFTPPVFFPGGGTTPSGPSAAEQAQQGILQWISQTMLSPTLSTLNPAGRLDFAQQQYVENLMAAQGGNVGALSNFTDMAQSYLEAARAFYGSTAQYQEIYAAVMGQAGGLAGLDDANRPTSALDSAQNTDAIIAAINRLTSAVAANAQGTNGAIAGFTSKLDQAFRDGTLTYTAP